METFWYLLTHVILRNCNSVNMPTYIFMQYIDLEGWLSLDP